MVIILTFFQCKPFTEIDGVWIHTRSANKHNQQFSTYGTQIFDFQNDSIKAILFEDSQNLNFDKSMDGIYKVKNKKLTITTEKEKFKMKINFMTDSFILTVRKLDKDRFTYKRLKESDKCNISKERFVNQSFLVSSSGYTDSIYFMNDSLVLHCGNSNLASPLKQWKLSEYNGYKFFYTNRPFFPGMLAVRDSAGTITLNPYIKKNGEVKLTILTSRLDNKLLIGSWMETQRITIQKSSSDERKKPMRLEIDPDEASITVNNITKTLNWRVTPEFSRIYFTNNKNLYVDSWKIIDLNYSTLKLRITDKTWMDDYIVIMTRK